MTADQVLSQYVEVNQVRLHYKVAGPSDGEVVLLLHGFPEFWYGWRYQIPALAEAGYRVVVPDQRGYNLSDKPRGVRQYDIELLASDMIGLLDHLGIERVHLAGHDWGAAVGWWLAVHTPQRLKRMAILNVPHLYVMQQNIFNNPVQRRKSWYIFFFQLPGLPELLLGWNRHQPALRMLERSGRPDSFRPEDLVRYQSAWSQPRTWTGMINWYRAIRRLVPKITPAMVDFPTLIIWGEKDAALESIMAHQSLEYCTDGRLELIPEATHWVQHDVPDAVNAQLIDFFDQ